MDDVLVGSDSVTGLHEVALAFPADSGLCSLFSTPMDSGYRNRSCDLVKEISISWVGMFSVAESAAL